jgi:hypothetical protein
MLNFAMLNFAMIKLRLPAFLCLFFSFSILNAQELLTVQQGQFFEQVYGGEHLESGTDIIQTPSERWVLGWTNFTEDESSNRQATLWFLDSINHNYQTSHYGATETDESGEAITQYGTDLIIGIRQSSSHPNEPVAIGDQTIIKYLDEDGVVQWSYNHSYKEEGLKPNDIIVDSNNDIVVLCDGINGSGVRYTQLLKFDLSGNLLNTYTKYFGASGNGAYSYELIQFDQSYYLTAANDVGLNYPISILFDISSPTGYNAYAHSSLRNYYHFGLTKNPTTKRTHIAGYRIFEEDTNATITILDSLLSIDNNIEYGDTGKQQLIDISQTAVGYMAVGTTNFNTEGADDCMVLHLDAPDLVTMAEILGSEFNDEVKHLSANLVDPKAFFSGMTLQFGPQHGNAYVGGTLAFPGPPSHGSGCEVPRMMMLDGLFDFSKSGPPYSTAKLTSPISTLQAIKNYGVEYVVLYGVDRLFVEEWNDQRDNSGGLASAFKQDVDDIQDLLEEGQRLGLVFGVVVDPFKNSIREAGEGLRYIHNRMQFTNGTHAGKATFMMLEHEFWNLNNEIWPLDAHGVFDSPLMRNVTNNSFCDDARDFYAPNLPLSSRPTSWTNNGWGYYDALLNGSYNLNNIQKANVLNVVYHILAKENHTELLQKLEDETKTSANFHASCDYISWLHFNGGMIPGMTKQYYTSVDLQNPALPTTPITETSFTNSTATSYKAIPDATFMVYYRTVSSNAASIPFDFNFSSPYTQRFDAYFSQNSNPFANIPLMSAEHTSLACMPLGANASNNYMGNWLGGANTLESAEADYMDQFIQNYQYSSLHNSTCNNCATLIQNISFCWYQFDCVDAAETSNGTFNNINNVSCYGSGSFGQEETNYRDITLYPNPFKDVLRVEGLNKRKSYRASIRNVTGQEIANLAIEAGNIRLNKALPRAVYLVVILENNSAIRTFKVIADAK